LKSLLTTAFAVMVVVAGTWAGAAADAAPGAPAASFTLLSDASCFRGEECLAVGEHHGGTATPVASLWNGGKWDATPVHLPSGATAGFLTSVSCKADNCVAVGGYTHGSTGYGLAELWNGRGWTVPGQPAGVPGAAQVTLESVSCHTAQDCVAAGYYSPKSNTKDDLAIAEVWNGDSWRVFKAPSKSYSNLDTVSCPDAGYCVLGGIYATSSASYVWAETFNGATWEALSVPQPTAPATHGQVINGVSCSSVSACAVVGESINESHQVSAFTETLSGGTWRIRRINWPARHQDLLTAVWCPAANYCIAAGGVGPFSTWTDGRAAFAIWNGSAWQLHVAPRPPSGEGNALLGVQCLSSAYCALTGTQGKSNTSTGAGLAGVVNAGTWTWRIL
jgi:hypothetical protein